MEIAIDISIDPGTSATGVCVWRAGRVHHLETLRPGEGCIEFVEKAFSISRQFRDLCLTLSDSNQTIRYVAIEDFERYNRSDKKAGNVNAKVGMIKCATVRGLLLGVADCFADEVKLISKGQISKEQTAMLCRSWGLKGSKDAFDAVQIGVCAGMDRRRLYDNEGM